MPATLAVLINNYNHGRYIGEAVESVLGQSRPADEIIVFDDGSDDNSVEVLRSFGGRIQLIRGQREDGPSLLRARAGRAQYECFKASSADWCIHLDGDDYFHRQRLQRLAEAIERQPGASMVQSPLISVRPDGEIWAMPDDKAERMAGADLLVRARREHDCDFFFPLSGLAFPRPVLEKILPLDFNFVPDMAADLRMCIAAMFQGPVVTLTEPTGYWRRRADSLSSTSANSRWYLVHMTRWRTMMFNHYADRFGERRIHLWQNPKYYLRVAKALLRRG